MSLTWLDQLICPGALQVSRTAVSRLTQKKTKSPVACKICSREYLDDGLHIRVYHGTAALSLQAVQGLSMAICRKRTLRIA